MKIPENLKVGNRLIIKGRVIDSRGTTEWEDDVVIVHIKTRKGSSRYAYVCTGIEYIRRSPYPSLLTKEQRKRQIKHIYKPGEGNYTSVEVKT